MQRLKRWCLPLALTLSVLVVDVAAAATIPANVSRDLSIGNCQLRIQVGNYGDAYARLTHRGGSCYPGTGVYLTAAHSGSQFSIECQFWTAARPGCNLDHRMVTAHVRGRASTATVRGCPTANRADCRSVLYFVLW